MFKPQVRRRLSDLYISLYVLLLDLAVGGTACLVIIVAILLKKTNCFSSNDNQEGNGSSNPESLSTPRHPPYKVNESEICDLLMFQNEAYISLHRSGKPVRSGGKARQGVCVVSMETRDAVSDEIRGAVPDKGHGDTDSEGYEVVDPSSLTISLTLEYRIPQSW